MMPDRDYHLYRNVLVDVYRKRISDSTDVDQIAWGKRQIAKHSAADVDIATSPLRGVAPKKLQHQGNDARHERRITRERAILSHLARQEDWTLAVDISAWWNGTISGKQAPVVHKVIGDFLRQMMKQGTLERRKVIIDGKTFAEYKLTE